MRRGFEAQEDREPGTCVNWRDATSFRNKIKVEMGMESEGGHYCAACQSYRACEP